MDKDSRKEQLKKSMRHPEPGKLSKELQDTRNEKAENKESSEKSKIDPQDELESREKFRDTKGKKK
jgi:hypothetical protein